MRRCTPDRMPASETTVPSATAPSSDSAAIEWSAALASTCSRPNSGWSETYRPSISRSKASLSALSHSDSMIGGVTASPAAAGSSSPNMEPNRLNCPTASLRFTSRNESIASACTASSPLRVCPIESNAPALISDSMVFLLHATASTLRRKS